MEIKIFNQQRNLISSFNLLNVIESKGEYYIVGIDDKNSSWTLGKYRTSHTAEKVLFKILKRYNQYPNEIMVLPEDDEDIFTNRDVLALPYQGCDE